MTNVRESKSESKNKKMKVILLLAMPAVIENFFQTIVGFVDTLFVSELGLAEVTAVGVANTILAVYFAIFMSIGVAANVIIANMIGANEIAEAKKVGQQSVLLAIFVGGVLGIVTLIFAPSLLSIMGVDSEVLKLGSIYFRIVAVPSIFISLAFVLSSILRGSGDTKSPMKVSIVINIINIVLDYVLIFGFFFIPPLGIAGAALATVIARMIGVIGLCIYINKSKMVAFKSDYWKIDRELQWNLISLGSPAAAERLVMRVGQVLYFGFIVAMGTNTFAAHQIAGSIEVFSYMIGYGFATAATILVGQRLGAHQYDEAKQYGKLSVYLGVAVMTGFGILLFVFGEWAGHLFTNNPAVIGQIKVALQIDAFIQPTLAVVLILTGIYQGGNNTKFPMYTTAIGIWLVRTVFVFLLGIYFDWGIIGIWIAIGLDNLFRALILWMKFQRNNWVADG